MKLSGKNHISILTRFFFVLLTFILTSLINPSKSFAGGTYNCNSLTNQCEDTCTTGFHSACIYNGFGTECTGPSFPGQCVADAVNIPQNYYICDNGSCDQSKCNAEYQGLCTMMGSTCTGPLTASPCSLIPGASPAGTTGVGTTVNPTAGCTDGINTALGCIPFESKAFTASLLGFLAGIIGAIALVVMLVGAITIMTAAGNPEAVKKGKELITGAITGLLFIIFSVALLRIVAGDIIKLPGFIQTQQNTQPPTNRR